MLQAEVKRQIMEYYENLPAYKLVLPNNSSKRQFKLELDNDTWKIIRDRIDTSKKLLQHILKQPVLGVYATIGLWNNPTILRRIVKHKSILQHKIRLNPMLRSDYVIDIDPEFVHNRKHTAECQEFITRLGYKSTARFTGRGSQIIIPEFFQSGTADPVARILECKTRFEEFSNTLLDAGFPIDYDVTNDWPTRVCKIIPNTLSRHGTVVEDIVNVWTFQPTKVFSPLTEFKGSKIMKIRYKYTDGHTEEVNT